MKPIFRVVEISQKNQSLLQWNEDGRDTIGSLHSLQMPTVVAQYIAETCNARAEAKSLLETAHEALIDNPCDDTREKIDSFLKLHWKD
jgi:hypothetical protein